MCVRLSLELLSETFLVLRRNEQDMITNVCWSLCKVPLFLSDFNETSIFSTDFGKNKQITNFMKIRQVEAELFHAHRLTDGQRDLHDEINP